MKAQGATEYLVIVGVVLMIALVCVGLLVWPTGTTKDAKKQQTDIHFKINEIGTQVEDDNYQSITQGLVAYYKFEDASGTTATDSRGGNTGTLSGPTWTSGKSGQALEFDGAEDYVYVLDSASLKPPKEFTISAWVKQDTNNGGAIATKAYNTGTWKSYIFSVTGGNISLEITTSTGASPQAYPWWVSQSNITYGSWNHVAAVYKTQAYGATDTKMYINGAEVQTTYTAHSHGAGKEVLYSAMDLNIGRSNANVVPNSYFNGSLDEVMIFNRALSASEILLLYENPGYPQ